MENTPLEVKTNSVDGSNTTLDVELYTAEEEMAENIFIRFFKPAPKYRFSYCNDWTNFPIVPPSTAHKIWRITLIRTSSLQILIHCNRVKVLNFVLSNTTCSDIWSHFRNRNPVVKIKFYKGDTASVSYRAVPKMSESEKGTVYVEDKSEGNVVGTEDDPDNYTCSKSSLVRRIGEDGEPVIETSMEKLSVSKEGDVDSGTPERVAVSKTVSKSAEGKSGSASAVSKMSASSSVSKSGSTKTASLSASAQYSASSKTSSSSSSGSKVVKMSSSSSSSSSSSARVVSSSSSSYSSSRSSSHSSSHSSSSSRTVTSSTRIVSSSSSSSSVSIKGATQKAVKE
ncbi:hypothetical protein ACHWQZ_G004278 [Mnemiopsis leidyi]